MAVKHIGDTWRVTEAAWGDTPERVIGTFPTEGAADAFARLMETMGDISEGCYAAGWMGGLEYALWEAVRYGGIAYGLGYVEGDEVAELRRLSAACDGWCAYGEDGEEYVPADAWRVRYAREHPRPEYVAFSDDALRRFEEARDAGAVPGLIAAYRVARGQESRIDTARLDAMIERGKLYRRIHQLETLLGTRSIARAGDTPTFEDVAMALDRLLHSSNSVSSREEMDARERADDVLRRVRENGKGA